MKLQLLISAIAAPALALVTIQTLPCHAESGLKPTQKSRLITSNNHIWVKVIEPISIEQVAVKVGVSPDLLSELNHKPLSVALKAGIWLVLPESTRDKLAQINSLNSADMRKSLPLLTPPDPTMRSLQERSDGLNSANSQINKNGTTDLMTRSAGQQITKLKNKKIIFNAKCSLASPCNCTTCANLKTAASTANLLNSKYNILDLGGFDSYIWPTKGVFTSGFGWRWGRMHQGIDIANRTGTPIMASKDGLVVQAGWKSGYGYLVEISHADGGTTRYAHNSKILVSKGQLVPQGATISKMGSTGRSSGPHLHFEIR
ncbi:MAG: M23 family metallopeptidase, partial [Prochlorococcus sp.]